MTGSNPAYDILPPVKAEKRQQRKKKKRGAFGIFKAALYMLRKRPDEKKEKSGGGEWKKIVHSMRPLHVQEMPASPRVHAFGADSSGTMSQYASANNLRDLCREDEVERHPDEVFDAIEGGEMIDTKAEEFIVKSIHHQNSIHRQDKGV
ncbi:hypothetical protein SASPL_100926 [Salvia splendens]|uniref:Uncharacterized protein n=1 Tax=Salvia splendens TaxID=180675 RepID=A0A8X8YQS3_SALSN|nr:uncharacterized protein LOC121771520 [Salvia splendens]KAG6436045.1 hypothetical protein SASPL_100926 [Salvia splendens]